MTPAERKSLAEQILTNPLFGEVFDRLESDAIEDMIGADSDEARFRLSIRINEIRNFRHDCTSALRGDGPDKHAVV